MPWAHGSHGAAANGEFAVLGAAFFLLGVILFIQRSIKPAIALAFAVGGATLAIGAFVLA